LGGALVAGFGDFGAGDHPGYFEGAGAVVGLAHSLQEVPSSAFAVAVDVLAQGGVHAGLVALALTLEPVDNVGIDAQ
jgi:hypothetical protein